LAATVRADQGQRNRFGLRPGSGGGSDVTGRIDAAAVTVVIDG
jgi:hypothetical protein